jgi:hypothetical protein
VLGSEDPGEELQHGIALSSTPAALNALAETAWRLFAAAARGS